jgi:hypothetical protein
MSARDPVEVIAVEDGDVLEYKKTLRWFLGSTVVLVVGLALSALS